MKRRFAACALAMVVAVGCADSVDQTAGRWQTSTDTIGDTIIVRTGGASTDSGARTLVEEVRIGKLDGPPELTFGDVASLAPAPNGGVFVADGQSHMIRQFDSSGAHVRSFGGNGAGPGEFDRTNGMVGLPDGRLALWDPSNGRINVYSASGESIDTWAFPTGDHRSFGRHMVFADTAGNTYLQFAYRLPETTPPANGMPPRREALFRYDRTGVARDTLPIPVWPEQPPQMTTTTVRDGKVMGSTTWFVRWRPTLVWTWNPLGYFVSGHSDRYAIDQHLPNGKILRIERDIPQVAIDPDERAMEEENLTRNIRRNNPDWKWTGPPMPVVKPYFDQIIAALDGRIWVSVTQPSERIANVPTMPPAPDKPPPPKWRWRSSAAYDVFEADGRYLGNVRMPRRTTIHLIKGNQVWAVVSDSLDVDYVTRFRVEPPF